MPKEYVERKTEDETIDPSLTPSGNIGWIRQHLGRLANRVAEMKGGALAWYAASPITLTQVKSHTDETTTAHGGITATTDSRLSDARAPTAHSSNHSAGGTDPVTPAQINALHKDGSVGMTGLLTLSGNPTSALHAAPMQYVDAARAGLDTKDSVRAASNTNHALTGLQTVDAVSGADGDRILLKAQSTGSENGIWIMHTGAWTRASDADTSAKVNAGMFVYVEQGTNWADSGWVLSTDNPITLGTTALSFTQFSQAGVIQAGTGLSKSGNILSALFGTSSGQVAEGSDSRFHPRNHNLLSGDHPDTDASVSPLNNYVVAWDSALGKWQAKAQIGGGGGGATEDPTKLTEVDFIGDYVIEPTGLLGATSATLGSNISAGTAYVLGQRVVKSASAQTYPGSSDTYVDLSYTGSYTQASVANGAGAPAVTANSMRLFKAVTSGTAITSVVDMRVLKPTVKAHDHVITDLPVAADNTSSSTQVPRADDTRLSNSRTPSGTAGGVLSGTYPNPVFAADMATQAELDAVTHAVASQAQTDTGTDDNTIVTPLKLATTPLGLLNLSRTEVSITGATTLTSTAFKKVHVLTGASSYAVAVPSASGNAGQVIGFRAPSSVASTVTFTIGGSYYLQAGEFFLLESDGTNWIRIINNTVRTGAVHPSTYAFNGITLTNGAAATVSGDLRGVNGVPLDAAGVFITLLGQSATSSASRAQLDSADRTPDGFSPRVELPNASFYSSMAQVALGTGANAGKMAINAPSGSANAVVYVWVNGWWR